MTEPVLDIHLRWRLYYVECFACFPLVLLVMCKETSWRYITWAKLHVGIQRKGPRDEIDYGNALHAVWSAELRWFSFSITVELVDNSLNYFIPAIRT